MFGGISVPVSELLAMAWHTGEEKYVAALEQYADEKGDEYTIITAMYTATVTVGIKMEI